MRCARGVAGRRTALLRCRYTKVLLLSAFLFCVACVRLRGVFAVALAWRSRRLDDGYAEGAAAGCRCENFSPGLLTVKKSVIRFRLSRPCLRTE